MSKNFNQKAQRGSVINTILEVLQGGDKYGYEIIKEVEAKTGVTLKQPSLYSCLTRLESQGLISSYWTDSDIGGRRHYYKLTDLAKTDTGYVQGTLEENSNDNSEDEFQNEEADEAEATETEMSTTPTMFDSIEDVPEIIKERVANTNFNSTLNNLNFIEPKEKTRVEENPVEAPASKFNNISDEISEIIKNDFSRVNFAGIKTNASQNDELKPIETKADKIEEYLNNIDQNSIVNEAEKMAEETENINDYVDELEEVKNHDEVDDVNYKEILGDFLKETVVEEKIKEPEIISDHQYMSEQQSFDLPPAVPQLKSDKKYINNILLKPAVKTDAEINKEKTSPEVYENINSFSELSNKLKEENITVKPYVTEEYITVNKNRYSKRITGFGLSMLTVAVLSVMIAFANLSGASQIFTVCLLCFYGIKSGIDLIYLFTNVKTISIYKEYKLLVPCIIVVALYVALLISKPDLYNMLMFLIPSSLIVFKAFMVKLLSKKSC